MVSFSINFEAMSTVGVQQNESLLGDIKCK